MYTIFLLIFLSTCSLKNISENSNLEKITFDINTLDKDGLSGKVSIDYEFCVPKDKVTAVQKIDPSLKIHPKSKGRSNCNKTQVLAIGNTHQLNHKEILIQLAELDFITKLNQVFWE